jgi:photosystem II stability/assembly factor-like uncharacterized protein
MHRTTAAVALLLTTGALAACGRLDPAAAPTLPTTANVVRQATVDDDGGAWTRTGTSDVAVTADAGHSWRSVRLPAPAVAGSSVAVQGNLVVAVTVDATGLAYRRSTDGGVTWTRSALPGQQGNAAQIALSSDARRVAVLVSSPAAPVRVARRRCSPGRPQERSRPCQHRSTDRWVGLARLCCWPVVR